MAGKITAVCAVLVLCISVTAAAVDSSATYNKTAPFDWGRPCTLFGTNSSSEITQPNNQACTACGSGATATPEPTCTFKPLTFAVGETIYIKYHSSVHDLWLGSKACDFATNVCPNATADDVSATKPCTYTFKTAGPVYISDKAGSNIGAGYCQDFGASVPISVTTTS